LAVIVNAYREEAVEGEAGGRTVLSLHPSLAPLKAGGFPLGEEDGMPGVAGKLTAELRQRVPGFSDESGARGRRYPRQDEGGRPNHRVRAHSPSATNVRLPGRGRRSSMSRTHARSSLKRHRSRSRTTLTPTTDTRSRRHARNWLAASWPRSSANVFNANAISP